MSNTGEKPTLPMQAALLLPHRPPMLLVDALLSRDQDKASATATVPQDGAWTDGKQILPEAYVELVAQTIAMSSGYDGLVDGSGVKEGLLVGVDSFACLSLVRVGSSLKVCTEKRMEFGPVTVVAGEVFQAGQLVAHGVIKVWEVPKP